MHHTAADRQLQQKAAMTNSKLLVETVFQGDASASGCAGNGGTGALGHGGSGGGTSAGGSGGKGGSGGNTTGSLFDKPHFSANNKR